MHNTSKRGKDFVQSFESCSLEAYPDPKTGGAPWTIGWGSTRGVKPGDVWTQAYAGERFEEDILDAEKLVKSCVTRPLTQGQFDALVSIFQNVGPGSPFKSGIRRLRNGKPSTLLRLLNAGDDLNAGQEFLKWVSPGSNVERGLRRRREGELKMFRS